MNGNEFLKKVMEDENFPPQTMAELDARYDEELAKPFDERDFDLMGELALTILEMRGVDTSVTPIDDMHRRIRAYEDKRRKRRRGLIIAACVMFTLVFPVNAISQKAYGMNVLSAIVEIVSGKMNVDFRKNDVAIDLPVSVDDPYGLKLECKSRDINVHLPYFIPNDFKLVEMEFNNVDELSTLNFIFKDGNRKINILMWQYRNELPENFQLPTENYFDELHINGCRTVVAKEKTQYMVTFCEGLTIYRVDTKNVAYEVLLGILHAFK